MAKVPVPSSHYFHDLPKHAVAVAPEAAVPVQHYGRYANDSWNLLLYIERNLKRTNVYQAAYERHMHRLHSMVLLNLVEAFERFLKEVASFCVDNVASAVIDDRLDVFAIKGQVAAVHFQEQSVGKALCESSTWLDCDEITRRFLRILAAPNDPNKGSFYLFPLSTQNSASLRNKGELVALLFQLRHSIVHNAGVITRSDAVKLSRFAKQQIEAPRVFWPERADVWYVKLFLDDLVETINNEIAMGLTDLTALYASDQSIFVPAERSQLLADCFQKSITIAGTACDPSS